MSTVNVSLESNEFQVKNPVEVKQVLEALDYDVALIRCKDKVSLKFYGNDFFNTGDEVVLSLEPKGDTNFVGVLFETEDKDLDDVLMGTPYTEDDVVCQSLEEYLQDQLLDGIGISIIEIGYTSNCFGNSDLTGSLTVITKNTTKYAGLQHQALTIAKELGVKI